jgi:hypothetical protein
LAEGAFLLWWDEEFFRRLAMIKRNLLVALFLTFSIMTWACSPGSQGDQGKPQKVRYSLRSQIMALDAEGKAQLFNQSLQDLKQPDTIVRRQAIRKIGYLSDVADIKLSIDPISDVLLNDDTPADIFTREMAAENLGHLAFQLGSPQGDAAINALAVGLKTGKLDLLRVASANALGFTKSKLAVKPLEEAWRKDHSPMVKYVARESLNQLAGFGIKVPDNKQDKSVKTGDSVMTHGTLLADIKKLGEVLRNYASPMFKYVTRNSLNNLSIPGVKAPGNKQDKSPATSESDMVYGDKVLRADIKRHVISSSSPIMKQE